MFPPSKSFSENFYRNISIDKLWTRDFWDFGHGLENGFRQNHDLEHGHVGHAFPPISVVHQPDCTSSQFLILNLRNGNKVQASVAKREVSQKTIYEIIVL